LGGRQPDGESGPYAHGALHGHRAPVQLNYVLHDAEAQACAAGLSGAGLVYSVEALKYPRLLAARDANAVVLY